MIYLASPYSCSDLLVEMHRFEQAAEAAAYLINKGHMIFSPITHSHPITIRGISGGWVYWKAFDSYMIKVSREVWVLMLDGWEESTGVQAEIGIARALPRTIRYVTWPELEIHDHSTRLP